MSTCTAGATEEVFPPYYSSCHSPDLLLPRQRFRLLLCPSKETSETTKTSRPLALPPDILERNESSAIPYNSLPSDYAASGVDSFSQEKEKKKKETRNSDHPATKKKLEKAADSSVREIPLSGTAVLVCVRESDDWQGRECSEKRPRRKRRRRRRQKRRKKLEHQPAGKKREKDGALEIVSRTWTRARSSKRRKKKKSRGQRKKAATCEMKEDDDYRGEALSYLT